MTDICKLDGELGIAAWDAAKEEWAVSTRSGERWVRRASVGAEGDTLVAFNCGAGRITLVTNRRLVEVRNGETRSIRLSKAIESPIVSTIAFSDDAAVWIGFNAGEWGGGLIRITRADGKIDSIESNRSGDLCGGPLNPACDPVHGIEASPWNPSCIVAAIGLMHMMSHGRIVEICGSDVRRIYFKPLDPQPPHGDLDEGEPSSTIAFFGLARAGGALWSVGGDGFYQFSGQGAPTFQPLPAFRNIGGYQVSFANPQLALILTDVNARASLSGAVPIMTAR